MTPSFLVRAAATLAVVISFSAGAVDLPRGVYRKRNPSTAITDLTSWSHPVSCSGGSCSVQMHYYGGHVISNPKVYAVYWGSSVDSSVTSGNPAFLKAMTNSSLFEQLAEYNTNTNGGTNQFIGRGTFGGSFTITPSNTSTSIADSDISSELDAQITAGNLPAPDANTIYMTYFPAGVTISQGSGTSCQDFCAYHGTWTRNNQSVYYGVFPDFSGSCSSGCGTGTLFQNMCSASTHELAEATTDAEIGIATGSVGAPMGWYDSENNSQGEIGDMCNTDSTITGLDGQTYTVQEVYSRTDNNCEDNRHAAQDFQIYMNPNTASVATGGSVSVPITTVTNGGNAQTLTLTATNLPTGVTATFDSASISSTGSTHLHLAASNSAAQAKDVVVVVKATAGSLVHTASVLLQVGGVVVNQPTIAITGVTSGATVGGTVSLTATGTAGAGSTLSNVTLSIDGTQVATGTAAATYQWNASSATPGSHTISATATDADGGANSTSLTVTSTATQPPTLTLNAPADGSNVSGTISLSATATPASGQQLQSVTISVDGTQVATGASSANKSWDSSAAGNGSHTISATATDTNGGSASAQVTVNVVVPPTVAVTTPSNNATVSSTVNLTATATAAGGTSLSNLTLSVNGTDLVSGASSPQSFSWDTTQVTNGNYQVTATATDSDGASATSSIVTVKVSNDFTLALSPSSATATIGGAPAVFTITSTKSGAPTTISLAATNLPAGVRAVFSATTMLAGGSATLTLTAPAGTLPVSAAAFQVFGSSTQSPNGHSASGQLTVQNASSGCASGKSPQWEPLAAIGLCWLILRRRSPRLASAR